MFHASFTGWDVLSGGGGTLVYETFRNALYEFHPSQAFYFHLYNQETSHE
jgi:hypothetical protein